MKALLVPAKDVPKIWNELEPLIDKALSYSTEKLKAFDFLVPILQGKVFLWIGIEEDEIETVFLCEPQQRNNEEISLWVHGIATKSGHGYKNWHPLLEDIKNFAKINGADFIEAKVRKGLAKKLKWNDTHSYVTLKL